MTQVQDEDDTESECRSVDPFNESEKVRSQRSICCITITTVTTIVMEVIPQRHTHFTMYSIIYISYMFTWTVCHCLSFILDYNNNNRGKKENPSPIMFRKDI